MKRSLEDRQGRVRSREEIIEAINKHARRCLDEYYRNRDADNFWRLDQILKVCHAQEVTKEEVPTLIEIQNVIVMG